MPTTQTTTRRTRRYTSVITPAIEALANASETFGVEIECYVPTASGFLSANDLNNELYRQGIAASAKRDGSLCDAPSGCFPVEFVTGILSGAAGLYQLEVLMQFISGLGAKVNRTCGLHVHIGARNLSTQTIKNFCAYYAAYEHILDAVVVAPSRAGAGCRYAQSIIGTAVSRSDQRTYPYADADRPAAVKATLSRIYGAADLREVSRAVNSGDNSRYHKLNLQSFWNHGTVEVRHHAGTVDTAKVINWVCLLQGLMRASGTVTKVTPPRIYSAGKVADFTYFACKEVSRAIILRARQGGAVPYRVRATRAQAVV